MRAQDRHRAAVGAEAGKIITGWPSPGAAASGVANWKKANSMAARNGSSSASGGYWAGVAAVLFMMFQ
jgi:hypothetical protein